MSGWVGTPAGSRTHELLYTSGKQRRTAEIVSNITEVGVAVMPLETPLPQADSGQVVRLEPQPVPRQLIDVTYTGRWTSSSQLYVTLRRELLALISSGPERHMKCVSWSQLLLFSQLAPHGAASLSCSL